MTTDTLTKARRRKAEIIAINGTIQRLNPLEKAKVNTKSLRLAVNAKCYECEGEDADPYRGSDNLFHIHSLSVILWGAPYFLK